MVDSSRAGTGDVAPPLTVLLGSPAAETARVGGKGASLCRLSEAGLPVPDGFLVATSAYRLFVRAGGLQELIDSAVAAIGQLDPGRLEAAARQIAAAFEDADLPRDVERAVLEAYAALPGGSPAVAVRSSATAEDLPELSFAGQQESFLNVRSEEQLLKAVKRCWASLWTARAIGYRAEHDVPTDGVAMAVVVQLMVPADAAGIVFTANPMNGRRDQLLVNASWGLGEAVVGGLVTPDTLVVAKDDGTVLSHEVATKTAMIVASGQGTTERPVPDELASSPVLDEDAVAELVSLARQIEDLFGQPMDIEWALAEGKVAVLQARPITSLPDESAPDVTWEPPVPGSGYIRRQVVEHMPDPLSPLFAELYLETGLERSIDRLLEHMGFEISMVNRLVQRPMFVTINGFAYVRVDYRISLGIIPPALISYVKFLRKTLRNPVAYWQDEQLPVYKETIEAWRSVDVAEGDDELLLKGVAELAEADAIYWFAANIPLGISKVTDGLVERLVRSLGPARGGDGAARKEPVTSGQLLRGFPSKTIEAQAALESVAREISDDAKLREAVLECSAGEIASVLSEHPSGGPALEALGRYLEEYGHQIYTLDFAEPTQAEDPLPVLVGLQAAVEHPDRDVRALQATFAAEREKLEEATARRLGPIRRPIFRKVLPWAQRFTPNREDAIFYVGAAWPVLRRLALELGRRLVEAGTLAAPDDVFYLRAGELREAIEIRSRGGAPKDFGQVARERRTLREGRMRLQPPATVPVDFRYKIGPISLAAFEPKKNIARGDTLEGFAVSPGRVTAPASVIRSPAEFEAMRPGTILVCPTTTPAWTPLFAQARGLVTDIGGVLAHGSIVAREYGIPAVMGTTVATERIESGQSVTVDGAAGTVAIH